MTKDLNSFSSSDRYRGCPIPKTHRRLAEAHLLWHQSLEKYHDPDAFRANLNATIEALRNVTFVLQNEKAAFSQFQEWYEPWQKRLKTDLAAKWLHGARTVVVHQGELESHSTAEVRLVAWKDRVVARLKVPVETPYTVILQDPQLIDFLEKYQAAGGDSEHAAIAIERRWCAEGLGDQEILESLAKAYGVLSELVLDAHFHLKQSECIPHSTGHPDFGSVHYRTGILACMAMGAAKRTQIIKLATGDELTPMQTSLRASMKDVIARYGSDETFSIAEWEALDPVRFAEKVLYQSKKMLRQDKSQARLMFIRDGRGKWQMRALVGKDRSEKDLLMRLVAEFVESNGSDAIVEVGEMWAAPADSVAKLGSLDLQHAKGRSEILFVLVATREGVFRTYFTPFSRGPLGGIKLRDTLIENRPQAHLEPILQVWNKQRSVNFPSGKVVRRLWEPDALDVCYCGGPKRFGDCCRPNLPVDVSSREIKQLAVKASTPAEMNHVEELTRAVVAQYVIWIKRHTANLLHVADDLYKQLVDIDVLALEELVTRLQVVLQANNKSELYVPQLRYLASIVGVPRLSTRLVAMASYWLFKTGKHEEAVLELDALGDLDRTDPAKFDDTIALLTIADLSDFPVDRKELFLRRALSVSVGDEEEHLATLVLADFLLAEGRAEEALNVVDSVIEKGKTPDDNSKIVPELVLMRYRIRKDERDLQSFKKAIERSEGSERHSFAIMLSDAKLYTEVEELLAGDIGKRDLVAILIVSNARIRNGNKEGARSLIFTLEAEHLPSKFRYAYAVTAGHIAISCEDELLRHRAISFFDGLSASGASLDQEGKRMLRDLQNIRFGNII